MIENVLIKRREILADEEVPESNDQLSDVDALIQGNCLIYSGLVTTIYTGITNSC